MPTLNFTVGRSGWALCWGSPNVNVFGLFLLGWSDSIEKSLILAGLEGEGLTAGAVAVVSVFSMNIFTSSLFSVLFSPEIVSKYLPT